MLGQGCRHGKASCGAPGDGSLWEREAVNANYLHLSPSAGLARRLSGGERGRAEGRQNLTGKHRDGCRVRPGITEEGGTARD